MLRRMPSIAFVDHSSSPLSDSDKQKIVTALFCQLCEFSDEWDLARPTSVDVVDQATPLRDDQFEIGVFDHADQAGAAGYHACDPRGKPYGKVFRDACDGVIAAPTLGVDQVSSHEGMELWGDKAANRYALRADGATLDAEEASDAVEDVTYPDPEGTGCMMSDYLTKSAFDPGAPGPYDRQGVLQGPYDKTPGGYRITATASNEQSSTPGLKVTAEFGPKHCMAQGAEAVHGQYTEARRRAKKHKLERRGVKLAA